MRGLAVVVALVASGCGLEKLDDLGIHDAPGDLPAVESMYVVTTSGVTCSGTISQTRIPEDTPTEIFCRWHGVTYQGNPVCYVTLEFRDEAPNGWTLHGSITISGSGCL